MSCKSIMALVVGSPDDVAVLSAAGALASRFAAKMTVLTSFAELPAAGYHEEGRTLQDERADALAVFDHRLAWVSDRYSLRIGEGQGACIVTSTPGQRLAVSLPTTDLVVMSARDAQVYGPLIKMMSEILMQARAPVLAVRECVAPLDVISAIAWDGGCEAGRAVRAALPILQQSSRVVVLCDPTDLAPDQREAAEPRRLLDYLSRQNVHDLAVDQINITPKGTGLYEEAMRVGAEVLIAGAYSHSPLQEMVLGGVTRTFLKSWGGPHVLLCR